VHTCTAAYRCGHFHHGLLKIINAEGMIGNEGFTQLRGSRDTEFVLSGEGVHDRSS